MIRTQYHGTIVLFVISRWEMPDSSQASLPHFAPYGKCLVLRWKGTAVFASYHFLKKVEPFCRKGRRQTSKRFYPVAAVSVPFSGRVGCKDFCCSVLLFRRMPVCFLFLYLYIIRYMDVWHYPLDIRCQVIQFYFLYLHVRITNIKANYDTFGVGRKGHQDAEDSL